MTTKYIPAQISTEGDSLDMYFSSMLVQFLEIDRSIMFQ